MACLVCRQRKAKCDSVRPVCGPCSKFGRSCNYAERDRKRGPKKRSLKQLEDKLISFERRLDQGDPSSNNDSERIPASTEQIQDDVPFSLGSLDHLDEMMGLLGPGADFIHWDFETNAALPETIITDMPPQETIDILHETFFTKGHLYVPVLHKARYLSNIFSSPPCLRYAVWSLGAELSRPHRYLADTFYRQARSYLEADEMRGTGEGYLTLAHAQTWSLVAAFETLKRYFPRAWLSCRTASALAQFLSLDRLDGVDTGWKRILPPPQDWIELEQRRRTFWVAFLNDRWSSSANGWPLSMDTDGVNTNLPSPESNFQDGKETSSYSFAEARRVGLKDDASPFTALILVGQLLGENMLPLHSFRSQQNTSVDTIWDYHHKIDNALSKMFVMLPEHLRVAAGTHDQTVVHVNMTLHASIISLHQATMQIIGKEQLDDATIRRSQSRCYVAAKEIAGIARMIAHIGPENMNLFITFPLFMASHVFLSLPDDDEIPVNRVAEDLEFLYIVFLKVQAFHPGSEHHLKQLQSRIRQSRFSSIIEYELPELADDLAASTIDSSSRDAINPNFQGLIRLAEA